MTRPPLLLVGTLLTACAAGDSATMPALDATVDDVALDASGPDALPDAAPDAPPGRCGDGVCARPMETCDTCPLDCNQCPRCDMAPTCTGALAVPLSTMTLAECSNTASGMERTNYVCGASLGVAPANTTCADPRLRIRVKEISIARGTLDLIGRNLYCIITAEDGRHSELMLVTPRETGTGRSTARINLRPTEGLLWGQGDLYRSTANITITYNCFLASDAGAAMRVLNDISGRAAMVSQHADGYGWVFGTVAVLGTIIGSALGTSRDTRIMDVQQTIAAGALLSMTNGRNWEIRSRRGNFDLSGASDLRLTLESWGCADVRVVAP